MMRIVTNYETQENKSEMVDYVRDFINENEEVIIVNIGTDKCIGDAVGPLVGTFLQESKCPLKVYGTLDFPIHAVNMEEKMKSIEMNHPFAKVIAIDACLGDKVLVGEVQVRDTPIHPGRGVGKTLSQVGNMSIIGITDKVCEHELFTGKNIRLSLVYNMAKLISSIILTACESIQCEEVAMLLKEGDN